jgi:hypothetical protein
LKATPLTGGVLIGWLPGGRLPGAAYIQLPLLIYACLVLPLRRTP